MKRRDAPAAVPATASVDAVAEDVQRLRRLAREHAERAHDLSKRLASVETRVADITTGAGATTTTTFEVTCGVATGDERATRDALPSDARASGTRAMMETTTTFGDGATLTARCASARSEYLRSDDDRETRVVTLDKVKYSRTIHDSNGTRVRAHVVPVGAEGVDAAPGGVGGGARRTHRLTGFGALGSHVIERCDADSLGAVSIEFKDSFAVHAGVFTGNRQPEDNMGKVLAQASFKRASSTRHANAALNASRCQSGETIVGGALTLAKTLPKTTRAIVANAWGQVALSQPNSREDFTEWGVAATVPPTKGGGMLKNAGWGFVAGKPANRGGIQAEGFLRLGGDGEEPGATLVPGVVVSTDDRGNRETTFACSAHLLW